MYRGEIYIIPEDLIKLKGCSRSRAYAEHKTIREAVKPGSCSLTIWDFCKYMDQDYLQVYMFLRGHPPSFLPK
jgi:molybdenum cofactor biosynthesis enzyme